MPIVWRRLLDEVLRFLAVGGVATIVAVVLFNWLVHGYSLFDEPWLAGKPLLAYVVANTVGMAISYHGTRTWAFRHREPAHADGGLTMYVLINVATMLLPVACLWFSRSVLGLDDPVSDNIAANVIGLALGVGARFFLFRQLVFSRPAYRTSLAGTAAGLTELTGSTGPLSARPTEPSTSDPAEPPSS